MTKIQNRIKLTTKDFLVSGESFDLIYNPEKEILFTSPQPDLTELSKYYESESYISHTDNDKGLMAFLYQGVKKYSLALKLRQVTSLNNGTGSILDIGAGTGSFLKLAKDNGWSVKGVEPNKNARSLAEQKDLSLNESIDELSGSTFDVVTLWHVLEHLPDLENIISKLEALVKSGGVLVIAVPNYKSYDAKYYKEYWAAYDVPRHLWHFSKKSMSILFSSKMNLIKSKPMIFDSFYVSLLSEKYKSGTTFSIKAILIGFWSNMTALKSGESSSLIYCFRKEN